MAEHVESVDRLVESFTPLPLRLALARRGVSGDGPAAVGPMALLWLDIVDSTRVTEQFIDRGPSGVEQLAGLLTWHFERLLVAITAHGGEPLMFGGDGLLSGWSCAVDSGDAGARDAVLRAGACGMEILAATGDGLRSGVQLRLHAILAFGHCNCLAIDTGSEQLCVTAGAGIADLQTTARGAPAVGRLLLSAAACAVLGETAEIEPAGPQSSTVIRLRGSPNREATPMPSLPLQAIEFLRSNVPLPIATRLEGRDLEWASELRRVTAVFVTLPDLDQAKPDIVARLRAVVDAVVPVVRRHDGLLRLQVAEEETKLLILFGVSPVVHPDDAGRAVRLAIDLRAELRVIGYRSSIGVATGRAFCGLIGNDVFRTWTELGTPMNLAARLAAVPQGTIQCDDATMRGARGVDFAPLGSTLMRGLGPTIAIWTPRRQDRMDVVADVPLHGRDDDLATLLEALHAAGADRAGTAPADAARLVVIEAGSGMGKSRLVAEFQQRAAAEGALVLAGHADPIERRVPYLAWRGVAARLLGIDGATAAPVMQHETVRAALGPEFAPRAALLNAVLPLRLEESAETQPLLPGQRAAARAALLLDLLRRAAAERPVLVTIDDAQWLDEGSWALVETAAAAAGMAGLCLVLAMQPVADDTRLRQLLDATPDTVQLQLHELSDEEQERLALSRLGAARMSPELAGLLRAQARGHPFFCLELAQALRDERIIEIEDGTCRIAANIELARLSLPDTAHATVARRIDRLDADSQLTLKVASVAGLRFPTALVAETHPTAGTEPERVGRHLALHHRAGLLLPEVVEEADGYAFRHGILRDTAYSLMLYAQRRRLHRDIAGWYERTYSGNLSRVHSVLAFHLEAAEEWERAAEYLRLEAERVFGLGLAGQSVEIGRHAVRLLGADLPPGGPELQREIGRELERIEALLRGRPPEEAAQLPPLADARAGQLIQLLLVLAPFAYQGEQPELFALMGCICLRLTLEHGNGPLAADVYAMYSVVSGALTGNRETAAAWSRLSLTLLGDRRGGGYARCAFIHIWFHNHWVAPLARGIALADAGAEAGFADNEVIYGCFNLAGSLVLMAAAGRPLAGVMAAARAAVARIANRVFNANFTSTLELQYAKALAGLTSGLLSLSDAEHDEERELAAILDTDLSNQIGYYLVTRVKLHLHAGDWAGALGWAERAQRMLPFFGGQTAEFELTQYRGLAALAAALFDGADRRETLIQDGWDCIEQLRAREAGNPGLFRHKADLVDGVLQAVSGRDGAAAQLLQQAAAGAARGGFAQDAGLAEEFLARCRLTAGDLNGAAVAAAAACDTYRAWGAAAKVALLRKTFGTSA